MFADERLKDGENFFLLIAWQLGGGLKKLPHLADRAGATPFVIAIGEQCFDGNVQRCRQALKLIGAQGNWPTLPMRVSTLRHAELVGQLLLTQSRSLAGDVQPLAENRTLLF